MKNNEKEITSSAEKREWSKPSVKQVTSVEHVHGGADPYLIESPSYFPS